jgi:hypothetical protein
VLATDEVAEQLRSGDVGEHGDAGADDRPVPGAHPGGPPAGHEDLGDLRVEAQLPAPRLEPGDERVDESAGAADRDREADLLAEHRQQPAEHRAARAVRRQVGVQRVAGEQQRGGLAGELLLGVAPHRLQRKPGEPQPVGDPERAREPEPVAHRREWAEQRRDQPRGQPFPAGVHPPPRLAVPGDEGVQCRRGLVEVTREHRAPPVGQRMREHQRRVRPAQPERREVQPLQHRRGGTERIERAEQVADEPWGRQPGHAADRAAGIRLRLEDDDLPTRVGEQVPGDQPIAAGADDDRVDGLGSSHLAPLPPRSCTDTRCVR